jgi:hypothetical protein
MIFSRWNIFRRTSCCWRCTSLFTDNWFTSPNLMNALKERGIRLCGAVRRNRKGLPEIPDSSIKSLRRGEWLQRQKGDMTLAVWKDQKVMWLLYNHCSPTETSALQRWNESSERVSVGCPLAVHDYFFHSRSVDVINQLHYAHLLGRKAKCCWPRLAWWLLDVCVINAYKLWSLRHTPPDHLSFRISLMNELLSQYQAHRRASQAAAYPLKEIPSAADHYPERSAAERDCVVCSHQPRKRVQSSFVCHVCRVHLCVGPCFGQYHAKL